MKSIKPVFRAEFRAPKGLLNPIGAGLDKFYQAVELRLQKKAWWPMAIVSLTIGRRYALMPLLKLREQPTLELARLHVAANFVEQVKPWEAWAEDERGVFRRIEPDELRELPDGGFQMRDAAEFTHISQLPEERGKSGTCKAQCSAFVKPDKFVSIHGDIAPTCRYCKELYVKIVEERKCLTKT